MSANRLSQLVPFGSGNRSVYKEIREQEEEHTGSSRVTQDGIDEANLEEEFHDEDLGDALADAAESQNTTESTAFLAQARPSWNTGKRGETKPRCMSGSKREGSSSREEEEEAVPQSFLMEGQRGDSRSPGLEGQQPLQGVLPQPVPGPSSRKTRIQWDTTRTQQQLYDEPEMPPRRDIPRSMTASGLQAATPEQRALYKWANVENLDNFLTEVYNYYLGKGMWSITLSRLLGLARLGFMVAVAIFLRYCIDYSLIPASKTLPEVIIPQCTKNMSFFPSLVLWVGIMLWFYQAANVLIDVRRLMNLREFYVKLLHITEQELQTISWQEIVGRLMDLRDNNPRTTTKVSQRTRRYIGDNSKDRMDAHDIANRIMRKDNYLIALFNKDILDMTLPLPFLRKRQLYSKNLEWNIEAIIFDQFFNSRGQLWQFHLKSSNRSKAIRHLQQRFIFHGCMNIIQAPFLISYYLALYILRYFKEFQRDPSQLSSRAYTPMAEWKFREFNELYHFFRRRTDMSHPFATRYLDQFPKDKLVQVSSFIAFVSGALLALLAAGSLLDPSNFLNFEITTDRTVLFYLGILTVIWTVCRGIVPEENQVFDPEYAIQEVINYTHYSPPYWKGRLHSDDVRKDFSDLYQMRILIFLDELLSFIFTPLVLWFSLPQCADRIVDFFREFTVHVDGLGYVCSYAVFEFNKRQGEGDGLRDKYYGDDDNKMKASYFSFQDVYGPNARKGATRAGHPAFRAPPPSWPALGSPSAGTSPSPAVRAPADAQPGGVSAAPASKAPGPASSAQISKNPTFEPTQSLLLDPHHQPTTSLSRHFAAARSRPGPHPSQSQAFRTGPERDITTTMMLEEDHRLGDSWRLGAEGDGGLGDGDEGEAEGPADEDEGVLGLLTRYQRAKKGMGDAAGGGVVGM